MGPTSKPSYLTSVWKVGSTQEPERSVHPFEVGEFMAATVASRRDHKVIVVEGDKEISPEILAQMEADGYVCACAPGAEGGDRKYYSRADGRRRRECDFSG
jgi:hypothetical protein